MYKLYQGDCLELLKTIPDKSVDLVLTDPPYGIDYQSGRTSKERRKDKILNDKTPFVGFIESMRNKITDGGGTCIHSLGCSTSLY